MITVVADSSADLPAGMAAELGVETVPIGIRVGSRTRTDGDAVCDWRRPTADGPLPEVVAPTAFRFREAFLRCERAGSTGIVVVSPSSRVSASHQAAVLAAESLAHTIPVRVIDSRTLSAAHGMVVQAAALAAGSGASLETVLAAVSAAADRCTTLVVVDDLMHLRRGGRLNAPSAFLGAAFGLRPILTVVEGVLTATGSVRGRRHARDMLLRRVQNTRSEPTVVHADAQSTAESLADDMRSQLGRDVSVVEVGPLVSAVTGSGAVGVVFRRA